MLLYNLLFSSVLIQHIVLCASYFLETVTFTSPFHHHASPLLLLPFFFPHSSSHAIKIPSSKWPHIFGAPMSTNLITISSNHFLIFKSFIMLISHLSEHVCITTFLTFFISRRRKNFISITCYILSAHILKYMTQLVIEGKNQKTNMSAYDIPLYLYLLPLMNAETHQRLP